VITTILPTTPTVTVKMMPQRVTQIEWAVCTFHWHCKLGLALFWFFPITSDQVRSGAFRCVRSGALGALGALGAFTCQLCSRVQLRERERQRERKKKEEESKKEYYIYYRTVVYYYCILYWYRHGGRHSVRTIKLWVNTTMIELQCWLLSAGWVHLPQWSKQD
jgi:hypothetical protein